MYYKEEKHEKLKQELIEFVEWYEEERYSIDPEDHIEYMAMYAAAKIYLQRYDY